MHRYDYQALHRDYVDLVDVEPALQSSGPDSIASTVSSASETTQEEYKAKYERLQESYKRLQKNNISLEEKLLNVSEKFSADKNLISRDLATQTQKVVEAKFTIQQLNRENHQLKSDLKIALNLLQNKPNAFVHQKLQSLPLDLQYHVREYSRGQEREKNLRNGGQRISVQIPGGNSASGADNDEAISAAILAKVLEQRERERSKDKKFCIDIGTQTHDWIFPDVLPAAPEKSSRKNADDSRKSQDSTDDSADSQEHLADSQEHLADSRDNSKTTSSKSQSWESDVDSDIGEGRRYAPAHVSNLLLASVIQSPPEYREGEVLDQRREKNYDHSPVVEECRTPSVKAVQEKLISTNAQHASDTHKVMSQMDDLRIDHAAPQVGLAPRKAVLRETVFQDSSTPANYSSSSTPLQYSSSSTPIQYGITSTSVQYSSSSTTPVQHSSSGTPVQHSSSSTPVQYGISSAAMQYIGPVKRSQTLDDFSSAQNSLYSRQLPREPRQLPEDPGYSAASYQDTPRYRSPCSGSEDSSSGTRRVGSGSSGCFRPHSYGLTRSLSISMSNKQTDL